MGRALGGRLLDGGHDLVVWNRTPGKAPDLIGRGAVEAGSVPEAVDGAAIALTMLANDDAVRDVAYGKDGVQGALGDDATYVDSSTVSPALADELADRVERYVAMPVLGSPGHVSSGAATYLVGASAGRGAVLDPLFPGLSASRHDYPHPRLAAVAKLTVNLLLLDGVVALAESFAVGRAGGLDDTQLRGLLSESPMLAPGLGYRFESILTGDHEPIWTTTLGAKDAGLALAVARAGGVTLPLTSVSHGLYEQAAGEDAHADIAAVADRYRAQR